MALEQRRLEGVLYEQGVPIRPEKGLVVGNESVRQADHTTWLKMFSFENNFSLTAKRGEKTTVSRIYLCANAKEVEADKKKEHEKRARKKARVGEDTSCDLMPICETTSTALFFHSLLAVLIY